MHKFLIIIVYNNEKNIAKIAVFIIETVIKEKDAYHVACAIMTDWGYFVTTDNRL